MKSRKTTSATSDLELSRGILERMATDLTIIVDRRIQIEGVQVERQTQRAAGQGGVHISFRFSIERDGEKSQGCLLVPLPEALTLAAYLMMRPDEHVAEERLRTVLDGSYKEALLEVGKFLAGACDAVLRRALPGDPAAHSEGCQGVRAGVRPAFSFTEGDELVVARARARIHDFEPFELVLMLPGIALDAVLESLSRP